MNGEKEQRGNIERGLYQLWGGGKHETRKKLEDKKMGKGQL